VRIVKWVLGSVFVLAALAVGAASVFFYVLHPKARAPLELKAPSTPEAIARGKYLAENVTGCLGCHSEGELDKPGDPLKPGMLGSGRDFGDMPGFPGRIRAKNLTPDPVHGIGKWTDGELVRAIREGVSRDGRTLFPMMPYPLYGQLLADDDALAIVAYLRTLEPIAHDPGPMEVTFPLSMFIRLAPKPVEKSPPPAPADRLARGQWLLRMASCADCHTPQEKGEPVKGMELAGGQRYPFPGGGEIAIPNITSDPATGIGSYTDEDLLRVLNEGVNKAGEKLYLMPWPWYRGMTEDDKRALIAALREVKPISNVVPASTITRR
jgi:mono/diheme cytochrome c family protein